MKKNNTLSNISNKKPQKIIFTNIKTSTNRSFRKNKNSQERKHSKIYNYEGLKTAVSKYNSHKLENKSIIIDIPIKQNINSKNDSDRKINNNVNNDEKINYISKLKEMNSNMDLILTGLKDNLENNNNKRKNFINIDNFIQQIYSQKENSQSSDEKRDNNIKNQFVEKSFSVMDVTNFNYEILNKKKYYIDINKLKRDDIIKLKYIYENNNVVNNKLDLDKIINDLYDYKKRFESLKKEKTYDENYFKEIIKKRYDFQEIEKNNEILKNEINILVESLTNSFYKGDLLLNRYYNKLKQIEVIVQNNIDDTTNDV